MPGDESMNVSTAISIGLAAFMAVTGAAAAESNSPLADAAKKNDEQAVRMLLEQSASVNAPQVDGMTALHWAIHDESEITKLPDRCRCESKG